MALRVWRTKTIIVFASDNGADWKAGDEARFPHRANADWRGEKAHAWEGGHRVPFLVRWHAQIEPGAVSAEIGSLTDFMATLAAVLDIPLPDNAAEDSFNLLPAWKQENKLPIRTTIVGHSIIGMFTIREGNWKLILGLGSGVFTSPATVEPASGGPKGQLYDLSSDPHEFHNLYDKHPDIVARLASALDKLQREGRSRHPDRD